jgi:hypothetical protein
VTELNASDGSVVNTIGVGSGPTGISSDGAHVWVSNTAATTVSEIAIPPSTAVVLPSNNATVSGTTQYLDATASPGVTNVTYEVSGGPSDLSDVQVATATPTIYGWLAAWNTTTVSNGSYTLQTIASYAGGVSGTSSGITINVNNSPPSTSVVTPSNNATVSGTSQVLDAAASSGVTQVQYEITGGTLTDSVIATATPTIYGWLAKWNTTGVANATYTLQSVATSNGMTGTSNPITITVNNPPPSTQVLIPASGATLDSSQNMVFDAVASPGVTKVSIVVNVNGFPLTFASTPTIYGWIATVPGSQPCADCSAIPEPSTIESVASYPGGVSGTSPAVDVTIISYLEVVH